MIFILVVLVVLGAVAARLSVRQHLGAAAELAAARAGQSVNAGMEWASFQVLRNPPPPAAAPPCFAGTTLTFPAASTLSDFVVTLSCLRTEGIDGPTTLTFYKLVATACNAPLSGACPNTGAVQPTYVERQLSRTLVR